MRDADPRRPWWLRVLGLCLVAHVVFGVQRFALRSTPRRLAEIDRYRELGPVAFHLGDTESARTVQELLRDTSEDAVILIRGETRGHMEIAAGLLAPRRLYLERMRAMGQEQLRGRPFAPFVLEGVDRTHLRVVGR